MHLEFCILNYALRFSSRSFRGTRLSPLNSTSRDSPPAITRRSCFVVMASRRRRAVPQLLAETLLTDYEHVNAPARKLGEELARLMPAVSAARAIGSVPR